MFIFLVVVLLLEGSGLQAAQSPPHDCVRPLTLAQRTGREYCWAQFQIDSVKRICVPHALWLEWLRPTSGGPICYSPDGRWRAYSYLENSTHNPESGRTHSGSLSHSPGKKTFLTQRLTSLNSDRCLNRYPLLFYSLWKTIERVREKAALLLAPHDSLGILRSLLLHEATGREPLPVLRRLGFVHLVSATGIHLYALATGWDSILRWACYSLNVPVIWGVRTSRISSFFICSMIWLLSGAHLGMLRPWIILTLRELSQILGFQWKKASPLFLALALDLAVAGARRCLGWPDVTLSGRWIYALAVGGGLMGYHCFSSRHLSHLGLAIGSWVFVALWEIWESGLIAVATPILSLLTLPLICLFTYPLLILGLVLHELGVGSISELWIPFLSKVVSEFILVLTRISLLPGNLWLIPRWSLLVALFVSCWIWIIKSFGSRRTPSSRFPISLLALPVLLGVLYSRVPKNPSIGVPPLAQKVEQLDVGQGEAALVFESRGGGLRKGERVGLIDAGSMRTVSDHAWMQLLAERQISKISWAAVTHLDDDHSGGILRLAKLIPIHCVALTSAETLTSRGRRFTQKLSKLGILIKAWNSNCIPFPALAPPPDSAGNPLKQRSNKRNANMGAIYVPLKSGGFYFSAGDASGFDEIRISQWSAQLSSQLPQNKSQPRILKVSHHGSRTSSAPETLELIQPTEAWISVGKGNSYGHPSAVILDRLSQFGIPIRRTDRDGVLSSDRIFDSKGVAPTKGAFHHPPPKHHPSPKRHPRSERN